MLFLKNTFFHKTQEIVSEALTVTSVAFCQLGLFLLFALLSLAGGLCFTHPCSHELLYSHALRGCWRGDAEVRRGE
jgi:hypothetical protein